MVLWTSRRGLSRRLWSQNPGTPWNIWNMALLAHLEWSNFEEKNNHMSSDSWAGQIKNKMSLIPISSFKKKILFKTYRGTSCGTLLERILRPFLLNQTQINNHYC